jgi:hypothetical protein
MVCVFETLHPRPMNYQEFMPEQLRAPALQRTTPQERRAALRPGHETS